MLRVRAAAMIFAAFVFATTPLQAHTAAELDAWRTDWEARMASEVTSDLLAEWRNMADRHPCRLVECPPQPPRWSRAAASVLVAPTATPGSFPSLVERWRPLVALYFPPDAVDLALTVMSCESGGAEWADNPRSTASGLFQHLASLWPPRAEKAGWAGASIWDPAANVAVAAWLSQGGSDWSHWAASRHCWG